MGKVPTLSAAIIQSISIVFTSNVSYGDVWHTAVLPPPKWQHISRSSKQWKGNKSGPNRRWVFNCISRLWNVCRRTIAKRYTQFIGCRVFGFMTTYAAPSNQCKLIRYTRRRKKNTMHIALFGSDLLIMEWHFWAMLSLDHRSVNAYPDRVGPNRNIYRLNRFLYKAINNMSFIHITNWLYSIEHSLIISWASPLVG